MQQAPSWGGVLLGCQVPRKDHMCMALGVEPGLPDADNSLAGHQIT